MCKIFLSFATGFYGGLNQIYLEKPQTSLLRVWRAERKPTKSTELLRTHWSRRTVHFKSVKMALPPSQFIDAATGPVSDKEKPEQLPGPHAPSCSSHRLVSLRGRRLAQRCSEAPHLKNHSKRRTNWESVRKGGVLPSRAGNILQAPAKQGHGSDPHHPLYTPGGYRVPFPGRRLGSPLRTGGSRAQAKKRPLQSPTTGPGAGTKSLGAGGGWPPRGLGFLSPLKPLRGEGKSEN